ncbi:MAG TPA: conjugal transfer protein TraF [Saccharospirillum sp.]|nr:conjugal transfer protein TraF [Saccharospirillum sp.]
MNRTLTLTCATLIGSFGGPLAGTALAGNYNYLTSSTAVSVGPISNPQIATSGRFNPSASLISTDRARFPVLDFTLNLQQRGLGEFNTVFDNMDAQINQISDTFDAYDAGNASVGDVLAEVDSLETSLDNNVELLADSFYLKPGALVNLPMTPLNLNLGNAGTVSLGVSSLTQARGSLLHGPIEFDIDAQTVSDASNNNEDLDAIDYLRTTSSVYLKQGQVFNFDVGYAQTLPSIRVLDQFGIATTAGVRGTVIAHNLQKHLYPLKDLARQASEDDSTLSEDISDDLAEGFENFNYDIALDLGVTFERNNTLVGVTAYNLNAPVLEYNRLGGDCASISNDLAQTECYHAEYFASVGDIDLNEEHRLFPHITVDASQSFFNNRIAVAAAADLWRKTDLFGEQSQNINLAFLAQPNAWYWPRLRLGVGKDVLDFEATQLGLGLSFFNVVQFDTHINSVLGDLFSSDLTEQGNALRSVSAALSVNVAF